MLNIGVGQARIKSKRRGNLTYLVVTLPLLVIGVVGAVMASLLSSDQPQPRDCFVVVVDDEAEDRTTTVGAVQSALLFIGCNPVVVLTPIGTQAVIEAVIHGKNGGQVDVVITDWDLYGEYPSIDKRWYFNPHELRTYEEYLPDEQLIDGPNLAELLRLRGYRGPVIVITRGGTDRGIRQPVNVGQVLNKPDFWANPSQFLKPLLGQ